MLTKELLTGIEGITDAQITAIVELSANDENAVIAAKLRDVHNQYDDTILAATGIKRNANEKSYAYAERVGKALAEKVTALEAATAAAAKGDSTAELAAVKAELTATKNQYNTLKSKFDTQSGEHATALHNIKRDAALATAMTSIKFSGALSESAKKQLQNGVLAEINTLGSEFAKDGSLIFKDATGAVLNNPNNKLNPYTATELLTEKFKGLGILELETKQAGAGGSGSSNGGSSSYVDVSAAKTRIEANDLISKNLAARGIARGSEEFTTESKKIWAENNVSALPEK